MTSVYLKFLSRNLTIRTPHMAALLWGLSCLVILNLSARPALAESDIPNVIVILTDDQGWTDTSVLMDPAVSDSLSDYYQTPALERLAREGMTFSAAYSASPLCSPSRASLLTGKSPQQLGMTDIIESIPGTMRYSNYYVGKKLIPPAPPHGLSVNETTVASLVKKINPTVTTAHFGKWHLGGGGPGKHGFDVSDGATGNGTAHGGKALLQDPNPKDIFGLTERAINFMEDQVKKKEPFYLQISHYADHIPPFALKKTIAKYKGIPVGKHHRNPVYAAMNENMDESIMRVLAAIDRLQIKEKTYIILTSDNGGVSDIGGSMGKRIMTSNLPLAAGKGSVSEGGIRVPMIVTGPGIAAGSRTSVPVIGWDILPTVCAIMGCGDTLPQDIEGGSFLPIVKETADKVQRPDGEVLVWHFPHYLPHKGIAPQSAIRRGQYKLIRYYEDNRDVLYDLSADIGEAQDLSGQMPQLARELAQALEQNLDSIDAALPSINTIYKP